MATVAYLLLPVTGLLAYFTGRTRRVRFHGLQAIVLGLVWPAALYGASVLTPGATQITFAGGLVLWLYLVVGSLLGRDPGLPGLAGLLRRWSVSAPAGASRSDEG